ncbi:MAG: hypothetical protein KatS3mg100_028 [Candidatus Parcubacteria bacterium]|nr:MAG: hypothetical protein KatS3mg100_028 [Candidatus Parcubacteria bacterium]
MALRADQKTLGSAAQVLQALAFPARLHIVVALARAPRGMVASDIGAVVGLAPAALSHQLRLLEQASIIEGEREGQHIRYKLARTGPARKARRIAQLLCEGGSRARRARR